jgi:hypothetical protein
VPGVVSNNNNVNTGPVFALFPVHRRPSGRVASDGGRAEHQQPPAATTAQLHRRHRQRAEVTITTSEVSASLETAGVTDEHRAEAGRQPDVRLLFVSGFSEGMQSDNFTERTEGARATQPNPVYHVYDVNTAVGGPVVKTSCGTT